MSIFDSVKNLFAKPVPPGKPAHPSTPEPEPEEIILPTLTATELQSALDAHQPMLVLDVREQYEWDQVHLPDTLHIPMNSVPDRLPELPHDRPIVVMCAHGSRSYSVAHYLRQQGFDARNLNGGITSVVRANKAKPVV